MSETNTLQLYCTFKGWQGGTLIQAMADYIKLSQTDKDKFCTILSKSKDSNTDHYSPPWFMNNRGWRDDYNGQSTPDCPACNSSQVLKRHYQGSMAAPECDFWECESCGYDWGHE